MMNFIVLVCNVILMACVVYDCFAVRKMYKSYQEVVSENNRKDEVIEGLIKENNVIFDKYNKLLYDNISNSKLPECNVELPKKKGRPLKFKQEQFDKALKLLRKNDKITLKEAFDKAGIYTNSRIRTLQTYGVYDEYMQIERDREWKKINL